MIKVQLLHCLGYGLTDYLLGHGWYLYQNQNGEFICEGSGDNPQSLIDSYNPWGVEKAKKIKEVNKWFSERVSLLTSDIDQEEKNSWPTQANEANGIEPLDLLIDMSAARGITIEQMVEKVKRKQKMYKKAYAKLQGEKDRVLDLVKAMPDEGELHRLPELWSLKCMD